MESIKVQKNVTTSINRFSVCEVEHTDINKLRMLALCRPGPLVLPERPVLSHGKLSQCKFIRVICEIAAEKHFSYFEGAAFS